MWQRLTSIVNRKAGEPVSTAPTSSDGVWLVVGLGNPGPSYSGHRHNVCYLVADELAHRMGSGFRPHKSGRADVVYGSRFSGSSERRVQFFWHTVGNRLLTLISNVVTNLNLTDMATCYKAFHRRVVPALDLESKRFGVDAEFTVKVARGGFRVFEVPVSYFGRSQAEGKKIRLKDGFSALGALARYSLAPRRPLPVEAAPPPERASTSDASARGKPA